MLQTIFHYQILINKKFKTMLLSRHLSGQVVVKKFCYFKTFKNSSKMLSPLSWLYQTCKSL